jgi:hypothetical protein
MTFALYRFGTLIARGSTYQACLAEAMRRGLAGRMMGPIELCAGVEIVNESNQIDLEDAIEAAR